MLTVIRVANDVAMVIWRPLRHDVRVKKRLVAREVLRRAWRGERKSVESEEHSAQGNGEMGWVHKVGSRSSEGMQGRGGEHGNLARRCEPPQILRILLPLTDF